MEKFIQSFIFIHLVLFKFINSLKSLLFRHKIITLLLNFILLNTFDI